MRTKNVGSAFPLYDFDDFTSNLKHVSLDLHHQMNPQRQISGSLRERVTMSTLSANRTASAR